jgi:hypothetical protein
MSLRIFNSQTKKKEEFLPLHEGKVGMYAVLLHTMFAMWDTPVQPWCLTSLHGTSDTEATT